MSVISDSCPTAPHLHSSGMNMLETAKSATSPSATPQFLQSDMPGLEQNTKSISPSNPVSSTSELMTNPDDLVADQRTLSQYVPAGTPGAPTSEANSLPSETGFPLLTTFPTKVEASVLPDLASSAGDHEGMDFRSSSLDVVSAILSDDSRNGSASFEDVENMATGSTKEENVPPSPSIPIVGDDAGKPSVVPDLDISHHGNMEGSVHLIQNIYAGSEVLTPGEILLVFLAEVETVYSPFLGARIFFPLSCKSALFRVFYLFQGALFLDLDDYSLHLAVKDTFVPRFMYINL